MIPVLSRSSSRRRAPATGGGGSYDPGTIWTWLKPDSLGLADGTAISSFPSSGTGGATATQATSGSRPIIKTGIANGHDVVRFASTYFNFPSMASLTELEMLVVLKLGSYPPSALLGAWYLDDGSNGVDSHFTYSDGNVYDAFGSTVRKSFAPSLNPATAFRAYNVLSKLGEWTARLNGTTQTTTASNFVGTQAAPTFGMSRSGSNFLGADVAELLIWPTVRTTSERADDLSYVTSKFAL